MFEAQTTSKKSRWKRLVQLRNLNIDPEVLLPRIPRPHGRPLGIPTLIEMLRREVPEVEIGNFSRPVRASRQ